METWKSYLKKDPTKWLLGKNNPSVRYLTLTEILDVPASDPQVKEAKSAIMKKPVVSKILAKQEDIGCWDKPERFYIAKYKGTVWQLIILAEHLADGKDKRIQKACEFILEHSQDLQSGGFSVHHSVKAGGGRHSEVIPCLTGNMLWCLLRFGRHDDPRVQRAIRWITKYQRFDDFTKDPPKGWPYDKAEPCWGKHTCHMGVVKALKALAEIPDELKSRPVKSTIKKAAEYLLLHHIHKKSHDLTKVSKPGWLRLGFPLMYQTDILEILGILTNLGYNDKRMQEAVDKLASKQDDSGKWILTKNFNGSFLVDVEEIGKPSKWITLNAMRVLKKYYK